MTLDEQNVEAGGDDPRVDCAIDEGLEQLLLTTPRF